MGHGSVAQWVKWVTFLDGSHGSWVGVEKHVHCILPSTKKLKVSPFDWFQHAPDDIVVPSASNTPVDTVVQTLWLRG